MSDPIRDFEHTHGELTRAVVAIGQAVLRAPSSEGDRDELAARLETLRDALLVHFANEEEALFPFVRSRAPSKAADVERLEAAHDALCGVVVRLAHMLEHDVAAAVLTAAFERFELAYGAHARHEAELFKELATLLDERQRAELGELLRGL